jgi:mono/diheme cytochrome c family protein
MAEQMDNSSAPETRLVGLLAEFREPDTLVAAAEQVREEGYRRLDAFTPFPVHGLDEALAIRPTVLPWLVLAAGASGAVAALAGQWWTNTIDYPFVVSGKPLFSLPANIPVAFEVIILLAGFTAFFGMLALNGLPRLVQPVFRSARFRRATADRFFLLVEAADPLFTGEQTRQFLLGLGATQVEELHDDTSPARLPAWIGWTLVTLGILALLPPLWIARARVVRSDQPRWHTFIDMDYQPRFKPQTRSTLFADGRADRLPVAGTVARGQLRDDLRLYQGIDPDAALASKSAPPAAPPPAKEEAAIENGAEAKAPETKAPEDKPPPAEPAAAVATDEPSTAWVSEIPLPVTEALMRRGQRQYNIFCAPCHGLAGQGDGLVARRAQELQQGTWIPPTSLHSEAVRNQPVGQLFHVISNGVRKMPPYAAQISVPDRWAIVLYLRALQRTQNARPEDLPPEQWKAMQP